jgi:acyl carrier protein
MESSTGKRVADIIVDQVGVKYSEIKIESLLMEDLGIDSLDVVEIIMAVEEEFGITVPDDDIGKIKTVQDIVDYVAAHNVVE